MVQAVAPARKNVHSPAGKVTVKDAVKRLVAEKESENLGERSGRDLHNRLDIFAQTLSERQVADIVQSEVANGWRELRGFYDESVEGISPRSKENYLITVLPIFNWVIAKRYRGAENPATSISKLKIDERGTSRSRQIRNRSRNGWWDPSPVFPASSLNRPQLAGAPAVLNRWRQRLQTSGFGHGGGS